MTFNKWRFLILKKVFFCIDWEVSETLKFGIKQVDPCQLIQYQIFTHSIYIDLNFSTFYFLLGKNLCLVWQEYSNKPSIKIKSKLRFVPVKQNHLSKTSQQRIQYQNTKLDRYKISCEYLCLKLKLLSSNRKDPPNPKT